MKKRNSAGFSAIELLMVLAIVGISAAMAFPSFLNYRERANLRRAGRSIVSDFQRARINSFRDTRDWAMQFSGTGYELLSARGDDGDWGTDDDSVEKTVVFSDFGNIRIGSAQGPRPGSDSAPSEGFTFTSGRVVFNSDGTTEVPSGTVYISNSNDETIAIGTLSATGRIKMWVNYGSGWGE